MSGGLSCRCRPRDKTQWRVVQRRCNYSAFSGYHYTPSEWSAVKCLKCGFIWRTKAAYVSNLEDA